MMSSPLHSDLAAFLASRDLTCEAGSTATYAAYLADYQRFLDTDASYAAAPFAPNTIRMYLLALKQRRLSAASLDNRYRLLKTCCRWLVEEEYIERDPFVGKGRVRPFAHKRVRRQIYTEAEVVTLLKAAAIPPDPGPGRHRWAADGPTVRESAQAQALILLLVDSAMRAGEVCSLTCGQVRAERLIIRSKGGHWDVACITVATRQVLRQLAGDRPDTAPLFRDRTGGRCSVRALRGILERLAERAGIELPPRPLHAFRHYAARQWLRAGLADLTIRQLMRHEQLGTTRLYTELNPDDLDALHAIASPITRLMTAADTPLRSEAD